MIREHLLDWRRDREVDVDNFQEYIDRVKQLPKDDQPCAAGLWSASPVFRLQIVMAFHHAEEFQRIDK